MERKVTFSALNQYRFIPLDEVLPDKYNFRQFDKALFSEIQEYWMNKTFYAQKVQKTDPCRIQIKTSQNDFPVNLYVYKCGGELVDGPFPLTYFPLTPSLIEEDIERFVHIFKEVAFFNDLDGLYYLVIECKFDEDDDGLVDFTDMFVSEPILVKEKHPKTMLLEYSSTTNRDDIIFQQTRQKFSIRLEAAIPSPETKLTLTVFQDQGENSVILSGTAFRGNPFIAGFSKGIPFWMVDKLNHILVCDSVYIEGKGYSLPEGSQLKPDVRVDSYGLMQYSIELADKNNSSLFEYSKGGITMFEDALTFPYVLYETEIGFPGNYDFYYGVPVRLADLTQLNAWITARNIQIAAQGLTGQIAVSTSTVVYNRGEGENYSYANSSKLTRRLGIKNLTTGVASIDLTLGMAGGLNQALWVVFNPAAGLSGWGYAPSGAVATDYNFNYVSPGAGTYTYEIWHEGTISKLYSYGAYISGIDKYSSALSLPPLEAFGIENSPKLTSFSLFGELSDLRDTLVEYRLKGNINLEDIGVYYPLLSWSTHGWRKLKFINLQQNKLSVSMVDQWFNSMKAPMSAPEGLGFQFYVYDGVVFINLQSPVAGASAASATARAQLISPWGWTLAF